MGFSGPWELIIIGGIVLLLFGSRLPGAAKSLGQSFSAFKKGIKEGAEEDETELKQHIPEREKEESGV